ncbi:MAG: hypothetical protein V3V02_06845 [Rhizobiaceae bacterium]
MKPQADEMTIEQLESHGYMAGGTKNHDRPVLICDVDEVVLHLVKPFVTILTERGFKLKTNTFKLVGNVYDAETGREATQAEVWGGLHQLFEEQAERQGLVDGAVAGLSKVAEHIDIVFLTNMPHPYGDKRREYLEANGLDFPLITNTGSKVEAIRRIQSRASQPLGFIDDTPLNLEQVRDALPDVNIFHFMADENFRKLAGEIKGAHFSTGCWVEASGGIRSTLMENNGRT